MLFKYGVEKQVEKIAKILGLDVNYFIKNGFWIFIRYIIIGLTGLAITISFTRFGTKQLLGQYQFILNFLSLLSIFSLPGLNTVALRDVSLGKDSVVKKIVRISFIGSLFALPIIFSYGLYQIYSRDVLIGTILILSGFLFPFFYALNTWYTFFEGKKLFKDASIRIIILNIAVALSVILAIYLKMQLFWIIFAFLFANILISGLFYFEVLKKIKEVSDGVDMKYGISCTFQKLTYSFSDSIPVLLISFVFGFELLAVYQVAYFSIALISGLIAALSTMYMPLLFKYKKLNYVKIIWQNLLLGLVFFVGFIVFIRIFFFTLYGNNYHESYILVKEFSFVIILMPLKSFLFNFFTAKNRNNFLIISNLMANLAALFIFYITRKSGFFVSIPLYFYLFSALVVVPLLVNYFLIASRKTDSILSEIN